MSNYLLRFKIDTCLTYSTDLSFNVASQQVLLLFSKRNPSDKHVLAELKVDATNATSAWNKCSTVALPKLLDSLSFATGTPLLLRDAEYVLKDETGQANRRMLYIGEKRLPHRVPIKQVDVDDTNKILAANADLRLPLCWHRYALDRTLALEQFVFNWLGFESLAGDADIPNRCPRCLNQLDHCGHAISHRSSDKAEAKKIFKAVYPDTTDKEFNRKIWGEARNDVFHGSKYPAPQYLGELLQISQKLHNVIDRRIGDVVGISDRLRPHTGYESWNRRFIFIEFATQQPNSAFAPDWPQTHLSAMNDDDEAHGPAHQAAFAAGIKIVDYNKEYPNW
jgi:hypothetical protein